MHYKPKGDAGCASPGIQAIDRVVDRFGRNLAEARHGVGISQEALGDLAAVHRTHIGYMETGKCLPRADTLVKLAASLTIGTDDLLAGIEWVVPQIGRRGAFSIDRPS